MGQSVRAPKTAGEGMERNRKYCRCRTMRAELMIYAAGKSTPVENMQAENGSIGRYFD